MIGSSYRRILLRSVLSLPLACLCASDIGVCNSEAPNAGCGRSLYGTCDPTTGFEAIKVASSILRYANALVLSLAKLCLEDFPTKAVPMWRPKCSIEVP